MADAGKIVITPKGKYNSTTTYEWLDEVTYDGKAYIALKTVTGVTPSDDGVNWRLFLAPNDIVAGNLVPTFTEASTRSNILSGENLSTILGKIKKYFTDLKGHAFNDPVNNLTTSTTGSALDASQGTVLKDEVDEINSNLVELQGNVDLMNKELPLTKTTQGTNPTIQDSTKAPLIYGKFNGYTEQDGTPTPDAPIEIKGLGDNGTIEVKTCGKNLIKISDYVYTRTLNGITLTKNEDGTYTLNGTATDEVIFDFWKNFEVKENYILSSTLLSGSVSDKTKVSCSFYSTSDWHGTYATLDSEKAMWYMSSNLFRVTVDSGVVCNNAKVGVMVRDTGDSTYEPYTETQALIPISAPLYDGDYMEVYADGSGKIHRENAKIDSYTGEEITTNYVSTTGELSDSATIVYKLETSTEELLTPEQVQAFKQLYTFDNVTNVFCDGETTVRYYVNNDCGDTAGMLHEYVDEIKNDLDKLNALPIGTIIQIEADKDTIATTEAKYSWQYLGTSNIQYENGSSELLTTNVYRKNN